MWGHVGTRQHLPRLIGSSARSAEQGWGRTSHPAHVPLRHRPARSSRWVPPTARTSPPPSAPWAPTSAAAWTCSPPGTTSSAPPATAARASQRRAGRRRRPRTWQVSWATGWRAGLALPLAGAGHVSLQAQGIRAACAGDIFACHGFGMFWLIWVLQPAQSSCTPWRADDGLQELRGVVPVAQGGRA